MRPPPQSTRTDTLLPYATLVRSQSPGDICSPFSQDCTNIDLCHRPHKTLRRPGQKAVRMKRALCAERTIPSCQRKIDDPAAAQTGQGASVPPLPVALPSDLHLQSFGGTSQPRHQAIGGGIKRELKTRLNSSH